MRKGFENFLARYPDPYVRNRYAVYGCKAGDASVTRDQLAIIGDKVSMFAWKSEEYLNTCRTWAAESMVMVDRRDAEMKAILAAAQKKNLPANPAPAPAH